MLSVSLKKKDISTVTMDSLRNLYYAGRISDCVSLIKKIYCLDFTIILSRLGEIPSSTRLLKVFDACSERLGYPLTPLLDASIETVYQDIQSSPAFIIFPRDLPLFGTQGFREFKLALFIFNWAIERSFESFIMCIAHELAHIVLYTIKHPLCHEETAVDITAILLGFYDVFRKEHNSDDGMIFGYLTPHQVDLAYREICRLEKVIYL
ncbi:MAG: hypothetical protein WC823_04720 [Parcubacteria group bacterium]